MTPYELLLGLGYARVPHSGTTLLLHLMGTHTLLREWGQPDAVCFAGLFHSVYGTESARYAVEVDRELVRRVIGVAAERIVYIFCRRTSNSFWQAIAQYGGSEETERVSLTDRITGAPIECTLAEVRVVAEIVMANALEQAPRVPEFWQADQETLRPLRGIVSAAALLAFDDVCESAGLAEQRVAQIPDFLTWTHNAQLLNETLVPYQRRRERTFETWLEASQLNELLEEFRSLPTGNRSRITMAPGTVELFDQSRARAAASLRQMIRAEWYVLGHADSRMRRCWSALGDMLGPGGYRAPSISDVIPIDVRSPRGEIDLPGCRGKRAALDPLEVEKVVAKLNVATTAIEEVSDQAASCVFGAIRVIAVKRDSVEPSNFGSSSWPRYVGKAGLTNAHLSDVSIANTANALLHESVHGFLYAMEECVPFIQEPAAGDESQILSPWTGQRLSLHSFLHACFVWFGLWRFWMLPRAGDVFGTFEVGIWSENASRGFLGPPLARLFGGAIESLSPAAVRAIEAMDMHVRSMIKAQA